MLQCNSPLRRFNKAAADFRKRDEEEFPIRGSAPKRSDGCESPQGLTGFFGAFRFRCVFCNGGSPLLAVADFLFVVSGWLRSKHVPCPDSPGGARGSVAFGLWKPRGHCQQHPVAVL